MFVCAFIHEACKRHGIATSAAITLGLQAVLLTVFVAAGFHLSRTAEITLNSPRMFYFLLALACAAMGLQNATLTRVGALSVRTTHVTGTLAKFAESGSRYIFWFFDKVRGPGEYRFREALRLSPHHKDFIDTLITSLLWIGFLAGGFCGVWLYNRWNLLALVLPIVLLSIFALTDLLHPFTAMEQ
jgi:uncharacterized membrane protein YoaK (UPF0700 family)